MEGKCEQAYHKSCIGKMVTKLLYETIWLCQYVRESQHYTGSGQIQSSKLTQKWQVKLQQCTMLDSPRVLVSAMLC